MLRTWWSGVTGWMRRHPWLSALLSAVWVAGAVMYGSLTRTVPPIPDHREVIATFVATVAVVWPLGGVIQLKKARGEWTRAPGERNALQWVAIGLVVLVVAVVGVMLVTDVVDTIR